MMTRLLQQAPPKAPGSFPSGICPGTAAEDPASGRTPAPGTEPDGRIKQCVVICGLF